MNSIKYYILALISVFIFCTANAQQTKKTATVTKKSAATSSTAKKNANNAKNGAFQVSIEDENFVRFLEATAKVMFIDSMVVNTADIATSIPLSDACGKIQMIPCESGSGYNYSYTNELGTKRFISSKENIGLHQLYVQEKLGNEWGNPEKVTIPGGLSDIICPYLMSDGVTLYFAASGGEDRLGKYDIYFTTYDSDNHQFYKPQSLGLPFNSYADDTYYIIDDFNDLGYLVTNRHQTDDNWCVYVFQPTETRQTYNTDEVPEIQLDGLARIRSIKDTQTSADSLLETQKRFNDVRNGRGFVRHKYDVNFIINASTVYHKAEDFKSPVNREQFPTFLQMKADQEKQEAQLTALRKQYHNGDKSVANTIMLTEYNLFGTRQRLQYTEKQIRNTELQALGLAK